jgi:hypothetical protein
VRGASAWVSAACTAGAACAWWASPAAAREPTPDDPEPRVESLASQGEDRPDAKVQTPLDVGIPFRLFGGAAVGRGLRFNNPYRLQTVLGDDAESLSLTAPYVVLHFGVVFGSAGRIAHGGALHLSFATSGVPQQVLTPSYVLVYRANPHVDLVGRAGLPIVTTPESNVGFELAGGAVYNVTAALGLSASLVGSLFYGAATFESSRTAVPVASLELGVRYDYEVLP